MTTETWIRFCRKNNIPSMALHEVGADEASTINGGPESPYIRADAHNHIGERLKPLLEDLTHLNPVSGRDRSRTVGAWWARMSKAERQQAARVRKANATPHRL